MLTEKILFQNRSLAFYYHPRPLPPPVWQKTRLFPGFFSHPSLSDNNDFWMGHYFESLFHMERPRVAVCGIYGIYMVGWLSVGQESWPGMCGEQWWSGRLVKEKRWAAIIKTQGWVAEKGLFSRLLHCRWPWQKWLSCQTASEGFVLTRAHSLQSPMTARSLKMLGCFSFNIWCSFLWVRWNLVFVRSDVSCHTSRHLN